MKKKMLWIGGIAVALILIGGVYCYNAFLVPYLKARASNVQAEKRAEEMHSQEEKTMENMKESFLKNKDFEEQMTALLEKCRQERGEKQIEEVTENTLLLAGETSQPLSYTSFTNIVSYFQKTEKERELAKQLAQKYNLQENEMNTSEYSFSREKFDVVSQGDLVCVLADEQNAIQQVFIEKQNF